MPTRAGGLCFSLLNNVRKLIIVESPTKERTIAAMLGKGYVVKSCWGHVRDLPKSRLGVNVENGFEPSYVPVKGRAPIIKNLKELAHKAPKIYLATDYDREGEAIAWHLMETIRPPQQAVERITFHEITPRAIEEAMKHPRAIDMHLVEAQQARRIIDRLVGYSISPLLWRKMQKGLSAGRVQSVALGFIAQREREVESFKPQEYWTLHAQLSPEGVKEMFSALLVKHGEKKIDKLDLASKDQVEAIIKQLEGASFFVKEIKETQISRQPQPPLTTAALQQAAHRAYGFSPARTMLVAQALYEGKKLAEGQIGLITYMRTDSISVASEARAQAAEYIQQQFGKNYAAGDTSRRFKGKQKFVQEAHEAIRPTSVLRTPETTRSFLNDDEAKLYELIWVRFLQSQMQDQRVAVTTITIEAGKCGFRASGSVEIFDGFRRVGLNADKEAAETSSQMLPALAKGQRLAFERFVPQQHFTEPPPRYNPASLVKALEANGVGRPSTYAPTIQTLLARHYVMLERKVFTPTDLGKNVYERLRQHFSNVVDVGFTASMENLLDDIAGGKIDGKKVLSDFWRVFEPALKLAEKNMENQKIEPQETNEKCEKCGAPLLLRESRFGKYLSCKRFPECTFKVGLTKTGERKVVEQTEIPCEQCGAKLIKRIGRRGPFLACPNFPKCRFTKSIPKPPEPAQVPPPDPKASS